MALAVSAFATTGHRYIGQFSSAGLAPGEMFSPSGLAIRQSTGDVYVLDPGSARVERFDAAGDFLSLFDGSGTPATAFGFPNAIAIDQSSGHVYVVDAANNAVDVFSAAGAYLSQLDATETPATAFASPSGVAVDPTDGKVYVSDTADNVVDVFDNTGTFITSFDGSGAGDGPFAGPTGIAVDAGHDVYVLDSGKSRVEKYTAQGAAFTSIFDSTSPVAVAIDPSSGEVYVGENGPSGVRVSDFDSSGDRLFTFGTPHIGATTGLDVNASTGTVYVADQTNSIVERFTTFLAPTVTTEGASGIEPTEATLAGTINPEGVKASYRFEFGTDTSYSWGSSPQPEAEAGEGSSDVAATTTLAGLIPGTTYHYRLVGTNAFGSNPGADQTFTTSPIQVTVGGASASTITTTSATLNATLNPNGADTTYRFEYGTTIGYGSTTADGDAGSVSAEAVSSTPLTGLQPGTVYHFRVVAENGIGGAVQGADTTFTTAPATAPSASNVTGNSATLNAVLIPGFAPPFTINIYRFEYGTDTSYGSTTRFSSLASGVSEELVSTTIAGLAPATTYHFRLVHALGASGEFTGGQMIVSEDATFTTVATPAVTTSSATAVTATSATLNASIDTHGVAGTVAFAVTSTENAYAITTPAASLAASNSPQSVSLPLTGVPPGAEYKVRASATVGGITVWGEPVIFTTQQPPPFAPTPPPPGISENPYGAVSNTVAPATLVRPSNTFTIVKAMVKGSTAVLTVRVPDAGKLKVAGKGTTTASKAVSLAATVKLTIHLSGTGKKALAQRKKLPVAVRVTFTPTGGAPAGRTKTVTFKRGGTR